MSADVGLEQRGTTEARQFAGARATRRPEVWRLAVLLVATVAVSSLAAFATASRMPPVFAARSEVIFNLRDVPGDGAERFLATQMAILESRTLLSPVATGFGLSIQELERAMRVERVHQSTVLRVEFRNKNPSRALEITKALEEGYLVLLQAFKQTPDPRSSLLAPAYVVEEPVSPKPLRAAALGAAAGIALAAAAGLWLQPRRSIPS